METIGLFKHYKKLWFYNFHRFKGNNYLLMRNYFAEILVEEVEEFESLYNKKVLDVGGARGEFCKVLKEKRNCDAVNLDPYPGKHIWPKTIIGFADNLPFKGGEFDIVICRGTLEHIPTKKQQKSVDEMYRVLKRKGLCYIAIPPWYNPFAGHHLKPFHIFPFRIAKHLRELVFRNKVQSNSFSEEGLYPITFRRMTRMVLKSNFRTIATRDTHLRLHFLTRIPIIREITVPTVAFILKK